MPNSYRANAPGPEPIIEEATEAGDEKKVRRKSKEPSHVSPGTAENPTMTQVEGASRESKAEVKQATKFDDGLGNLEGDEPDADAVAFPVVRRIVRIKKKKRKKQATTAAP